MAWNPINGQLAFGMSDSRIYVWDEKEQTARFMHAEWIGLLYTLTFSPDGRYLASSGTDNLFHVCDMSQDRMLFKAPGEALRFSADGRRLAAIVDEELVVYEIVNARALNRVPRPGEAAEFSPDGNWLATAGAEGVHLYSADQYRLEADLGLDACGPVAFHPDSGSLVTFGTFSHQQRWPIRLVDRTDGSDNLDSDTLRSRAEPGATDETGLAAGTWRIGPPQPLTDDTDLVSLRLHLPLAPQHFGRQVAISRNGRLLATMNVRSGQLLIADAESAAPPRPFSPFFAIRRVAISPDAQWVAAAGDYVFRHVGVFATADARAIFDIADHASATFSSDGEYFACSSRQEVRLYRVGSWQLERTIPIERPSHSNHRDAYLLLVTHSFTPGFMTERPDAMSPT
jgi:WD40 repeat protein